jgi:hypothetical protein
MDRNADVVGVAFFNRRANGRPKRIYRMISLCRQRD